MSIFIPPRADELELSVIGPGRGECLVIHIGENEWCVVDSCVAPGSPESVAVEYLNGLDIGALSRVRLIVATHWHDDHIRGLSSIFRRVPGAHFVCSAALNTTDFVTLVEAASSTLQGRSGVDEFASIFQLLVENAPAGRGKKLAAPRFALANRTMLDLADGRAFPVRVIALSPSDGTLRIALTDIAKSLPTIGEAQRRIVNRAPNRTSVVLWFEVGQRRILLGADLEHTGHAGEGWMAVLACHRDPALATLFKVPHHGSANADCPEVWKEMLVENPIAIVTPFSGKTGLFSAKGYMNALQFAASRVTVTAFRARRYHMSWCTSEPRAKTSLRCKLECGLKSAACQENLGSVL